MALTDAERLQMTAIALMRYSKIQSGAETVTQLIVQPTYTTDWPVSPFDNPYETLAPYDYVGLSYDYEIT